MYRPRPSQPNNPSQGSYRLTKQSNMPSEKDLEFAYGEACKRKGQIVELPWGSDTGINFILTVTHDSVWSLFEGTESSGEALWRHNSGDIALIHSLVFQSVPDDLIVSFTEKAKTNTGLLQAASMPADSSKASMTGRLEDMQIANLLQSIQMSKMSGRLQLFSNGALANIFYLNGDVVHAVTPEAMGDSAVVEIIAWENGDFRFFPSENTQERTIKNKLDTSIVEGITLLDYQKFLDSMALTKSHFLLRTDSQLSQEEFKNRLVKGLSLDFALQKWFYENCDGRSKLQDILDRRPLMKAEWLPLVFNLINCNLLGISELSSSVGKAANIRPYEIDKQAVLGVSKQLVRAETGMFTFPAFLYLLEEEFLKSVGLGMPLALIVFELCQISETAAIGTVSALNSSQNKNLTQPLSIQAMAMVAEKIRQVKRSFDMLSHFETFDFAILLPGASAKTARIAVHKISEIISHSSLKMSAGIAAAPEDTQDLARFISVAKEAKSKAKESGILVKTLAEI